MTVAIEPGHALMLPLHARIMHRGLALHYTIDVAESTPPDSAVFALGNVRNGLTSDRYRPNAAVWSIEMDLDGGARQVSCVCVGSPGVFAADQTYALEYRTVAGAWVKVGEVTPIDGSPIMFLFATKLATALRLSGRRIRNLLSFSEQFENVAFTKIGGDVAANVGTAPDGAFTADSFVEDTSSGEHYIDRNFSVVSGATYTISTRVKQFSGTRRFRLQTFFNIGQNAVGLNLETGVLSVVASASIVASGVVPLGDGWFRVWMTMTATGTGNAIFRSQLNNGVSNFYLGDGSSGVLFSGIQLNEGVLMPYQATPLATLDQGKPDIYNIMIGNPLVMQRPFYAGFAPSAGNRMTEVIGNLSRTGELLGRSVKRTTLMADYQWRTLSYDWVVANLYGSAGLIQSVEAKQAYVAWRPGLTGNVDYCMRCTTSAPQSEGTKDQWLFAMNAEVHAYE